MGTLYSPRRMGVSRSLPNQGDFTMFFTFVKLILLPSALGLVHFPPVQVSKELRFCEDEVKALTKDPESDAYIDQILANLATVILENGLDPATLPDADTGFSDTILGITLPRLCPSVQWALLATVDNPQNWRDKLHRRRDQSPTHSQRWGGGPHRPLRCLSGVHGNRGVSWDHGRHRRLWNIH